MTPETGTPAALFDYLIAQYGLKNDVGLIRELEIDSAHFSKVRRGILPMSATMILKIHEHFGMAIQEIRDRSGKKAKWRK
jgi:hypothetical protein